MDSGNRKIYVKIDRGLVNKEYQSLSEEFNSFHNFHFFDFCLVFEQPKLVISSLGHSPAYLWVRSVENLVPARIEPFLVL